MQTREGNHASEGRAVESPEAANSSPIRLRQTQVASRAERKRLRKHYRTLAGKDEWRGHPSTAEDATLPPRYSIAFLRLHLKAAHENFWIAHSTEMNPDYSPRSLTQLDEDLPDSISEEARRRGYEFDSGAIWAFHAGLGSYIGEVIVRSLGGEWKYPNRLIIALAWLLNRPDILYKHWYVVVGRVKVPVFEIARRRETLGREKASLLRAYEEIANSSVKRRHKRGMKA